MPAVIEHQFEVTQHALIQLNRKQKLSNSLLDRESWCFLFQSSLLIQNSIKCQMSHHTFVQCVVLQLVIKKENVVKLCASSCGGVCCQVR